jgi:hypothetical protein
MMMASSFNLQISAEEEHQQHNQPQHDKEASRKSVWNSSHYSVACYEL